METIRAKEKTAEEVVRQYALALSTFDVEPIVYLLHPDFKFVYWTHYRGHGLRTDIRYIGYLYRTFLEMKRESCSIKTKSCYIEMGNVRYFCLKLLPPNDNRIIYPLYESTGSYAGEVLLLTRVKNGLLCKVECYTMEGFNRKVGGEIIEMG